MIGKRELKRQIKAKDETIALMTVQLRELRDKYDEELQHRENLTVAENIDADEKAALKRGNDRLKEDNQRLIDEINDTKVADNILHAMYNARERMIVVKHGTQVADNKWVMPYDPVELDAYSDDVLMTRVYVDGDTRMVEVSRK